MNQAPAAEANQVSGQSTAQLPSPHRAITIFPSPKMLMLPPVIQDGITAEFVLLDSDPKATESSTKSTVITPHVLKVVMVRTIPSKWSAPMYDEDAEPWDKINPYDRNLVLPSLPPEMRRSSQVPEKVNLLNMFEEGREVDGKIIMPRRPGDSGNFSFWSGGKITSFVKQAIMLGGRRGCRVKLQQAIAEDAKLFLSDADCPIKMIFAFEPSKQPRSVTGEVAK